MAFPIKISWFVLHDFILHPCLSIPSSFLSYINASPFICRMELKSSLTRWQLESISAQRGEVETIIVVNRAAASSWETFKVNYIFCTYNWKCMLEHLNKIGSHINI